MSGEDRKTEPPFGRGMDVGEALKRFIGTVPGEVDESVELSKQKKPPGDDVPRRPALKQPRESGTTSKS